MCPKCGNRLIRGYDEALRDTWNCIICGWFPRPEKVFTNLAEGDVGFRLTKSKMARIERELNATKKVSSYRNTL